MKRKSGKSSMAKRVTYIKQNSTTSMNNRIITPIRIKINRYISVNNSEMINLRNDKFAL